MNTFMELSWEDVFVMFPPFLLSKCWRDLNLLIFGNDRSLTVELLAKLRILFDFVLDY